MIRPNICTVIGLAIKSLLFATNIVAAEMSAYHAIIEPIGNIDISGTAVVMTMADGSLFYGGSFSGLEPNLSNCMAENGCGVHIHSGRSCEDSTSQGGHLYESLAVDPWQAAQYSSNGLGQSTVGHFIQIGTTDVAGRAFVGTCNYLFLFLLLFKIFPFYFIKK